jgi:hypothetical protein
MYECSGGGTADTFGSNPDAARRESSSLSWSTVIAGIEATVGPLGS